MSLLLRRGWHTSMSLLPSAMALLVLRILVGIFFHLIATSLVFIARVNEVPLLVLLPQIVVAHLWLLVLIPISSLLQLGGDNLARQGWTWGALLRMPDLGVWALGQLGVPDWQVEAVQDPLDPLAVAAEHGAPDDVSSLPVAQQLPVSGRGLVELSYSGSSF